MNKKKNNIKIINQLIKIKILNANLKIKVKILIIIIFCFIEIKIRRRESKSKVLICTIAKEENKYINEFVAHYRRMKIKKIILYDNNDINGEKFDDILKNDINNHFIEIINIRGIKQPQTMALNDCYQKNNKSYEWIAFYDIDEFLYIKHYHNLNTFLSLSKFKKCQSILINWKYYGDNDKLYYEPKPLKQRFIKEFPIEKLKTKKYYYSASKTIVRGGLTLNWAHLPHYISNVINCKPDGSINKNYFSPPQFSIAYIKHYITKSTEEFIERINRGDVIIKINNNYIKERINNYYFLFNPKTREKLNLFQQKVKYIKNVKL